MGFQDTMKRAWGSSKAFGGGMRGLVSGGSAGRGILGRAGVHRRAGYNMMMDWSFGRDLWKKGAWSRGAARTSMAAKIGGGLGLISTLYEGYSGYQEGGALGAVGGVAKSMAMNYALGMAWSLAKGPALVALGATAAAVGIGAAATNQSVASFVSPLFRGQMREHAIKHATLEMGAPTVDPFGTVSTMRQRSLMAIQNSRVNGRTALGNEAMLLYRPYSL